MKRRNFLKTSALLAGSATLPNLAWSAQSSDGPLWFASTTRLGKSVSEKSASK